MDLLCFALSLIYFDAVKKFYLFLCYQKNDSLLFFYLVVIKERNNECIKSHRILLLLPLFFFWEKGAIKHKEENIVLKRIIV
jgi:hypothetical protein